MTDFILTECSRADPEYKSIRDRHYVPNHGCIGRQLHYKILLDNNVIGIISGASAVWACAPRDEWFGITKENRVTEINKIINNVVFRLELRQHNLASEILAEWRKRCKRDWIMKYGGFVRGFETFIFGEQRDGRSYRADNWTYVGETKGSAKVKHHGAYGIGERSQTDIKHIFCHK